MIKEILAFLKQFNDKEYREQFLKELSRRSKFIFSNQRGEMYMGGITDKIDSIASTNGGRKMKAILHLPTDTSAILELQKRVAKVHADAVLAKVNSLPLPKDKLQLLIDEIAKNSPVDRP